MVALQKFLFLFHINMNNIFNNDSWIVESGPLFTKNLDIPTSKNGNIETKNIVTGQTKLKYLKPIFFDNTVRIDIELVGDMVILMNDTGYKLSSNKLDNNCIMIKNWNLECSSDKLKIPESSENQLKLIVENSTLIKKFTIVQDLKIDNCNPNN